MLPIQKNMSLRIHLLNALLAGVMLTLGVDTIQAQQASLFQRRDPYMMRGITPIKAMNTGDLLTVIINERTDVENIAQRTMNKQSSSDSSGSAGLAASGDIGTANLRANFDQDSSASRNSSGNTQFLMERAFTDRIAVRVVDVQPNGNLVIQGSRRVGQEGDQRTLVFSGVVRHYDIANNNTIPSNAIADLRMDYVPDTKTGAEDKFLNQGWLGKKLNRLWPY